MKESLLLPSEKVEDGENEEEKLDVMFSLPFFVDSIIRFISMFMYTWVFIVTTTSIIRFMQPLVLYGGWEADTNHPEGIHHIAVASGVVLFFIWYIVSGLSIGGFLFNHLFDHDNAYFASIVTNVCSLFIWSRVTVMFVYTWWMIVILSVIILLVQPFVLIEQTNEIGPLFIATVSVVFLIHCVGAGIVGLVACFRHLFVQRSPAKTTLLPMTTIVVKKTNPPVFTTVVVLLDVYLFVCILFMEAVVVSVGTASFLRNCQVNAKGVTMVNTCDTLDWMTFLGEEGKVLLYASLTIVCIAGIFCLLEKFVPAPEDEPDCYRQARRLALAGVYLGVCFFLMGILEKLLGPFTAHILVPGRWEGPVDIGDWIKEYSFFPDPWSLTVTVGIWFVGIYVALILVEPLLIPDVLEFPQSMFNRKIWRVYTYGTVLFLLSTECVALTWYGLNLTEFQPQWVSGRMNPDVPGEYIHGHYQPKEVSELFIGLNKLFVGVLVTCVVFGTSAWLTKKKEREEWKKNC